MASNQDWDLGLGLHAHFGRLAIWEPVQILINANSSKIEWTRIGYPEIAHTMSITVVWVWIDSLLKRGLEEFVLLLKIFSFVPRWTVLPVMFYPIEIVHEG